MEIENNRLASVATLSGGQNAPVEKQRHEGGGHTADTNSPAGGSSDKISLTGQAQQLQELEKQLASQPVVDSQRVEAVRNAVENGSFTVNPERIADKLISLEQALTDAR
jgi:negative regulator of flagellin synthesis FlgM